MRFLVLNWRDIQNPLAGGAEKYIHEICKRWVQTYGHEVVLFTSSFHGADGEDIIDGVKIIRRGNSITIYFLAFLFYMAYWRGRFDCILEAKNGGLPWFTRFYAGERAIALVHQTGRDFSHSSYLKSTWRYEVRGMLGPLMYLLEPFLLSPYRFSLVIAVSHSTKARLLKLGLDSNAVRVVLGGTNSAPLDTVPEKEENPTLLYLGRIKRSKRLSDLVKAAFYVRKTVQNLKLWIVGRGDSLYLNELKRLIDKLHLTDNVKFFGYVNEEIKKDLVSRAHLLVLPSIREGWGLVVTEANALGTPVVAYNVAGLTDSVRDKETGLLVESGDVQGLARGIIRVLVDKRLRLKLSRNALNYARWLTWDKSATEFLKVVSDHVCFTSDS